MMCIYLFYIVSAFELVFNPDTWRFMNVSKYYAAIYYLFLCL